jgi:hypothetical protein
VYIQPVGQLRERICTLRCELQAAGLDHGPVSIAARLQQEGLRSPSVLHNPPHPHRRRLDHPGTEEAAQSSSRRFRADQPNECWQSDFTHWQLADGTGVEIINWFDDHSRYLLATRAYRRITGQSVITTFKVRELSVGVVDRHLGAVKAKHGPSLAKTTRSVLSGICALACRHDALPPTRAATSPESRPSQSDRRPR